MLHQRSVFYHRAQTAATAATAPETTARASAADDGDEAVESFESAESLDFESFESDDGDGGAMFEDMSSIEPVSSIEPWLSAKAEATSIEAAIRVRARAMLCVVAEAGGSYVESGGNGIKQDKNEEHNSNHTASVHRCAECSACSTQFVVWVCLGFEVLWVLKPVFVVVLWGFLGGSRRGRVGEELLRVRTRNNSTVSRRQSNQNQ